MSTTLTARYQINATFRITGRGLVLAGLILEGLVNSGDIIEFEANGILRQRRIKGVEGMRKLPADERDRGLLIECINDEEIEELRNWTPDGVIALVYKAV